MAGHSHWANIKYKKGREDLKRGKLFSKLSNQIIRAAREGGGDSEFNVALRNAIEEARKANMPRENIEKAIARGAGEKGARLEKQILEGYGPSGVAFLVRAATDNRNRTLAEVRKIFERFGGSLGEAGCTAYIFKGEEPQFRVALSGEERDRVGEMVSELENHPDVVNVLTNATAPQN